MTGEEKAARPGKPARLAVSMEAVIIAEEEVENISAPWSMKFLTMVTILAAL